MSLQDSVSTPVRRYRYIVNITSLCDWVPFPSSFLMKMSRGGEAGFSVPRICSAGALKEGFDLLSVPLMLHFCFSLRFGGVFRG